MKRGSWTFISLLSGGGSFLSALNGDNILAFVMLFCNAAILLVNCAVEVYRRWRDRDKDLDQNSKESEEYHNEDHVDKKGD